MRQLEPAMSADRSAHGDPEREIIFPTYATPLPSVSELTSRSSAPHMSSCVDNLTRYRLDKRQAAAAPAGVRGDRLSSDSGARPYAAGRLDIWY